jgi:hypothetical protein
MVVEIGAVLSHFLLRRAEENAISSVKMHVMEESVVATTRQS